MAHLHRAGGNPPVRTVSELAFLRGLPKAILEWIDIGGQRTPICIDLDPDKLEASSTTARGRFCYGEITVDPRMVATVCLPILIADAEEMDARYRRVFPDADLRFARTLREALELASQEHRLLIIGMQFDGQRMFELLLAVMALPGQAPVAFSRGRHASSDVDTVQGIALVARALGAFEFLDFVAQADTEEGNREARRRLLA